MITALGEVCSFLNGGTPSRSVPSYFSGSIPWITGADVTGPTVTRARAHITQDAIQHSATNLVAEGAVLLVTRTGVGKVALAGVPLCFSQDITAILPQPRKLDARYLARFLETQAVHLKNIARGATIQGITREVVEQLRIPLPSLQEQRRIAAILDQAEALRAKRRQALAKLETLPATMFARIMHHEFETPARWPWPSTSFAEVVHFQEGPGVRNWQFRDSGVKLINVKNIVDGTLVTMNTNRYLSPEEAENKYSHFLLNEGDYVMASSGVTWGKIAEVTRSHLPLCLNTSMIRLRPKDRRLTKAFLRLFIDSRAFRSQIDRLITGSAQPNFGPSHLRALNIPLPPLRLQESLEATLGIVDSIRFAQTASIARTETLFTSLQHQAFQGTL